jgi:hypothetical protein
MDSKILVIAGMHRSGTSLISQWLYRSGLNLGDRLLGSSLGNLEGHFEDLDFLRFHEETLSAHQLSDYGFVHQSLPALSAYEKAKMEGIIYFKSSLYAQWGWKEPRTCLFLDHYREIIPGAYYLVIVRDFNATVSSLIQRDLREIDQGYKSKNWFSRQNWYKLRREKRHQQLFHQSAEFYLKIWITYNEALLKTIRHLSADQFTVVYHSESCESDTAKLYSTLVDQWGFSLRRIDFKEVYNKSLLTGAVDIDPFIEDKELLKKASALEAELKGYS